MPKKVVKTRDFNINVAVVKNRLIYHISKSTKYDIILKQEDSNNLIIGIDCIKSFYSRKGEHIVIIIKEINDGQTTITIESELKATLQIFDNGKNHRNIQELFHFIEEEVGEIEDNSAKASLKRNKGTQLPIKILSCKYCGGHPNLVKESSGSIYIYLDRIEYHMLKKQFEIPMEDILAVELLTHEQITQRYTVTRLLAFGFLALGMPKKNKETTSVVTIRYRLNDLESTLFLEADDTLFKTSKNIGIEIHSSILKAKIAFEQK